MCVETDTGLSCSAKELEFYFEDYRKPLNVLSTGIAWSNFRFYKRSFLL